MTSQMARSSGRATGLRKRKYVSAKNRLYCPHIRPEDQLNLTKMKTKTNNRKLQSEAGRIGKCWVTMGGKRTGKVRVNLTPDRVFVTTE